jgi:predicted  nucleic acid-binding Zn-ribbon protein
MTTATKAPPTPPTPDTDRLDEVTSELKRLRGRRQELQAALDKAESEADAAREELVQGDASPDDVQDLEGRVSTLTTTLGDVEDRIAELQAEKENLEGQARRRDVLEELAELVGEAAAAKDKRNRAFRRAVTALEDAVEEMAGASERWQKAVRRFQEKAAGIMPRARDIRMARHESVELKNQKREELAAGLAQVDALAEAGVDVVFAAPRGPEPYEKLVGFRAPEMLPDIGRDEVREAIAAGEKARLDE